MLKVGQRGGVLLRPFSSLCGSMQHRGLVESTFAKKRPQGEEMKRQGSRGYEPNGPEVERLASMLNKDTELAMGLVSKLNHATKLKIANMVLDDEAKEGRSYSQLASRHRRAIMVREISMSLGHELHEKIDKDKDGEISNKELEQFLEKLTKFQEEKEPESSVQQPTKKQMYQMALLSGIPFVGFGFVDNAIMLVAGDIIDVSIGRTLGISTLAAAGLGNLLSDIAGLGLGGYIEASAKRLGLKDPKLTLRQLKMRKVRLLVLLASTIGITIGCLLGMVPLLFMDPEENEYREIYDRIKVNPEDDKPHVEDFIKIVTANESIIGSPNTKNLLEQIQTTFPNPKEVLSFHDFKQFLQTSKLVQPFDSNHRFALELCDICRGGSCNPDA